MGLSAFGIFELLFRLKLLFRFASLAVPNGHRHRPLPASSNICNHQGLSAWSMPSPRGRCVLCFVLDYIRLHSCFTFCCNCLWFVVVQSLRDVQLFATPRTAAHQSPLSSRLLGFAQIHVPWVGDANCLTLCCPLFLFLQSFPASGSFPASWLFASRGQSIAASASASLLPINIQGWFPLGLTGLFSLLSMGLWRVFSSITIQKHQFFGPQPSLDPTLIFIHDYWKNHSFDSTDLYWQGDVSAF